MLDRAICRMRRAEDDNLERSGKGAGFAGIKEWGGKGKVCAFFHA